jgi:hypothetical protein
MDSHQRRILKRLLQQCEVPREIAGWKPSDEDLPVKTKYKPPNELALGFSLGAVLTLLLTLLTWGSYPTVERFEIVLVVLILFGSYLAICVADYAAHKIGAARKTGTRVVAIILWISASAVTGWRLLPGPPTITMQISPSALPLSVAPHSDASVLKIHPYINTTDKQDDLLKITNDTGVEGCWPSQTEMDSLDASSHETIYRLKISNHSPRILEGGKLAFALKYNVGQKGGGCLPPSETQHWEDDVVLIPPIDPGKSFEFFAVNYSSQCAWLIPPSTAAIVMDGEDRESQVALIFDKNPLYEAGAPSFSPTLIKWEDAPVKPRGYGISRTGTHPCGSKEGDRVE